MAYRLKVAGTKIILLLSHCARLIWRRGEWGSRGVYFQRGEGASLSIQKYFIYTLMRKINTENTANGGASVKVWDVPVRLFHWTLVLGFASAYLTAEYHFRDVHVLIGYGLCLLLVARVFWGFAGSQYARFSSFIFSPAETIAYMRSMFGKHPVKHYLGHNPAGALMVFTLLGLLALIFSTGLVTLAVIDFEGPLMVLLDYVDDETSYAFRHLHELLTDVGVALVVLHLMGVVGGSIQHKENLVRAMITGRKTVPSHSGAVQSTKLD